jgi:hypothetical protein
MTNYISHLGNSQNGIASEQWYIHKHCTWIQAPKKGNKKEKKKKKRKKKK